MNKIIERLEEIVENVPSKDSRGHSEEQKEEYYNSLDTLLGDKLSSFLYTNAFAGVLGSPYAIRCALMKEIYFCLSCLKGEFYLLSSQLFHLRFYGGQNTICGGTSLGYCTSSCIIHT